MFCAVCCVLCIVCRSFCVVYCVLCVLCVVCLCGVLCVVLCDALCCVYVGCVWMWILLAPLVLFFQNEGAIARAPGYLEHEFLGGRTRRGKGGGKESDGGGQKFGWDVFFSLS